MTSMALKEGAVSAHWEAIARGQHTDPFSILGPHKEGAGTVVRCFQPQAVAVTVVDQRGDVIGPMVKVHDAGIFVGRIPDGTQRYRYRIKEDEKGIREIEDPYRFSSQFGELDLHLIGEGTHKRLYDKLGSHVEIVSGVSGVHFAVWAPNARRVSVVGDFNDWDGRRHVMRRHPGVGVWDIFVPELRPGVLYKFELLDRAGILLPLKSDPLGQSAERPPGNASIVYKTEYVWNDEIWLAQRPQSMAFDKPQCIYEVHLGSWRRKTDDGNRWLTYIELADELVDYVCGLGFTHIELLPVSEHPFDGSWGYQPIGLYAPTWRFGKPDELRYFIDRCHQAGVGVIMDWVPAHFPRDPNGLGRFDGTALYEHEDPRQGLHPDWDTLVFNYGRSEITNYLISNALFWVDEYHIDGLRVDAVASMLYLDYSRKAGEWLPNEHGGRENIEAVSFLRRLNEEVHQRGAVTIAEESTAWPGVSRPTYDGGLGFSYKWNMGWMNDTLSYMKEDPVHRKHHHDRMTFGLLYAFDENFLLPLSHDEVVHGKGSLLARMPGDDWQRFANLRAYYGFMYGSPGKKLLFMGDEFAQLEEWNHDRSLDWHLCDDPRHAGVQRLVGDLNRAYTETPAVYEMDVDASGFEWIDCDDSNNSVFSWLRRARNGDVVIFVANFTPIMRQAYRIGVSESGTYAEFFNSDLTKYGGSGVENIDTLHAQREGCHGRPFSLTLTIPPLATIMLKSVSPAVGI
jgi:1,4-alpha-glucan branching enzyme